MRSPRGPAIHFNVGPGRPACHSDARWWASPVVTATTVRAVVTCAACRRAPAFGKAA